MEVVTESLFVGSKTTADGDCSHEIERHLLLGRKTVTKLDNILKSRDITLLTKVHLVKAMVFSNSHTWMWELDYKECWVPKKLMFSKCGIGETIALTRWTLVVKVMSLLFNMLSRWVTAFLPRSKHLLISYLQWFWSPPKIKSVTVSTFSPSICHELMGLDAMI